MCSKGNGPEIREKRIMASSLGIRNLITATDGPDVYFKHHIIQRGNGSDKPHKKFTMIVAENTHSLFKGKCHSTTDLLFYFFGFQLL